MKIEKFAISSVLTVLFLSLVLIANVQLSRELSNTIVVPDDYSTLQAAINAANPGDTISVKSGTYTENIIVNKTVSIIGENKETTVILSASPEQDLRSVVLIEANDVTMSGFKILNSTYHSIWVKSSDNTIKDNIIEGGNWEGIFLDGRTNQANQNTIIDNYITEKDDAAIVLMGGSSFNLIRSNVIARNYFGIFLYGPSDVNNIISENKVTGNLDIGICVQWDGSNNTIMGNNISDNGWISGLPPYYGGTYSGIFLVQSYSNRLVANLILHNKIGIRLNDANGNKIFHNNFVNNSRQVLNLTYLPPLNIWDNGYPSGGNFWSNYTGVDLLTGPYQNVTGSDGIGDNPYIIDNYNRDRYPLMNPYSLQLITFDMNYDLKVDIKDLAIASVAFGSYPGHSKWNPIVDVNRDVKVDIRDLVTIAKNFGREL